MSVIDSRRYGRRSTTSFTREEFMIIKNTPPADYTELDAECARVRERMRQARERKNAGITE